MVVPFTFPFVTPDPSWMPHHPTYLLITRQPTMVSWGPLSLPETQLRARGDGR